MADAGFWGGEMASLADAVDRLAAIRPQWIALRVAGSEEAPNSSEPSISYEDLAKRSVSIATALLKLGVQTQTRWPLGCRLPRGADWYVLYVASSRLGIPLASLSTDLKTDRASEQSRNDRLIELLQPQLLVVGSFSGQDPQSPSQLQLQLRRVNFSDLSAAAAAISDPTSQPPSSALESGSGSGSHGLVAVLSALPAVATSDLLCYCFTGGSTGRQRCVAVSQRVALHELKQYPKALGLEEDFLSRSDQHRVLQPSSVYWAAAAYGQIHLALALAGVAVVTEVVEPLQLASICREERVSVLGLTPSLWDLLRPEDFRIDGGGFHLQRLISWGEPCPKRLLHYWNAKGLPWRLFDLLIATEFWLSFVAVDAEDVDEAGAFTCLPDMEIFIRSPQTSAEVPIGEIGELCICGEGLCSSFVSSTGELEEDPQHFQTFNGQLYFCSGDMVKKVSNRSFAFVGRSDDLVKVAGKWVDLAALAQAAAASPGVKEAAPITLADGRPCVAVVLAKDAGEATPTHLHSNANIPSGVALAVVPQLPRHPATNKVQRDKLMTLVQEEQVRHRSKTETMLDEEAKSFDAYGLVAAVVDVLQLSGPPPLSSSLRSLGADSSAAIRISSKVQRQTIDVLRTQGQATPDLSFLSALQLLRADSLEEILQGAKSRLPLLDSDEGMQTRSATTAPFTAFGSSMVARAFSGWLSQPWSPFKRRRTDSALFEFVSETTAKDEILQSIGEDRLPNVEAIVPCLPLQELMLTMLDATAVAPQEASQNPGRAGSVGSLQTLLRFDGGLAANLFREAWVHVQRTSTPLRTQFVLAAGKYWQVVMVPSAAPPLEWKVQSLNGRTADGILEDDANIGFADASEARLWRLTLFVDDEDSKSSNANHSNTTSTTNSTSSSNSTSNTTKHNNGGRSSSATAFFLFTIHNSLCDGWSANALLERVLRTYHELARSPSSSSCSPLGPPSSTSSTLSDVFSSDSNDLRGVARRHQSRDLEALKGAWLEELGLDINHQQSGQALVNDHGGEVEVDMDVGMDAEEGLVTLEIPMTRAQLSEVASRVGVTPAALLFTTWSLVWATFRRARETRTGVVMSGRELVGDKYLGCSLSLVPLCVNLSSSTTLASQLAASINLKLLNLMHLQDTSPQEIRSFVELPKSAQLYDHVVILENAPEVPADLLANLQAAVIAEKEVSSAQSLAELRIVLPPRLPARSGDEAHLRLQLEGPLPSDSISKLGLLHMVQDLLANFSAAADFEVHRITSTLPFWSSQSGPPNPDFCSCQLEFWTPRLLKAKEAMLEGTLPLDAPRPNLSTRGSFKCLTFELEDGFFGGSEGSEKEAKAQLFLAFAALLVQQVLPNSSSSSDGESSERALLIGLNFPPTPANNNSSNSNSNNNNNNTDTTIKNDLDERSQPTTVPYVYAWRPGSCLDEALAEVEAEFASLEAHAGTMEASRKQLRLAKFEPRVSFRLAGGEEEDEQGNDVVICPTADWDLKVPALHQQKAAAKTVLRYNADVVDEASAKALLQRFRIKLKSLKRAKSCSGKPTTVADWVSTSRAKRVLLQEKGIASSPALPEVDLWTLLRQQRLRTPNSTALTYEGASFSYTQLHAFVDYLVLELLRYGVLRPGTATTSTCLGILADRSVEAIAALTAAVSVGASYCPLSPAFPISRLQVLAETADLSAVLIHPALRRSFQELVESDPHRPYFSIDIGSCTSSEREVVDNFRAQLGSLDCSRPLYVLFTSGSTGQPKPVPAPQRAALTHLRMLVDSSRSSKRSKGSNSNSNSSRKNNNNSNNKNNNSNEKNSLKHAPPTLSYGFCAGDRQLVQTALPWVASMPEIWAMPLLGGTLAVARGGSKEAAKDLETLQSFVKEAQPTLMQFVPSVLTAMLRAEICPLLPTCRHLVLTGEPLTNDLCKVVRSYSKSVVLRNHYGQTEAADTTTVYRLPNDGDSGLPRNVAMPIGEPALHRQVWLSADFEPQEGYGSNGSNGATGELLVGGPGLLFAGGQQGTMDSPLGAGACLLTGDLARWTASEDMLICMGRKDRQVKIRGHRIELGEIEAVVRSLASSLLGQAVDAVALLYEDPRSRAQQIVAYVTPEAAGANGFVKELQAKCKESLLAHAVPSKILGVDKWPRTSTGKLDRKALLQLKAPSPSKPAKGRPSSKQQQQQQQQQQSRQREQKQQQQQALHDAAAAIVEPTPASQRARRQKLFQFFKQLVFALLVGRGDPLRTLGLPFFWLAASALKLKTVPEVPPIYSRESEVSWWGFFVLVALMPRRLLWVLGASGALLAGPDRALFFPAMWWGGITQARNSWDRDIRWYWWYLSTLDGLQALIGGTPAFARRMAKLVFKLLADVVRCRGDSLQTKRKLPAEWSWDRTRKKNWRAPRLEKIDLYEEVIPTEQLDGESDVDENALREALPEIAQEALKLVDEEVGYEVPLSTPISSLFDSLALTGFVAHVRRRLEVPLTLKETLGCDRFVDFAALVSELGGGGGGVGGVGGVGAAKKKKQRQHQEGGEEKPAGSDKIAKQQGPRNHRVREWGYMLGLAVTWRLRPANRAEGVHDAWHWGSKGKQGRARFSLDERRLKRALKLLQQRHPALRTTLRDPPGWWNVAMEAAANFAWLQELSKSSKLLGSRPGKALIRCLGKVLFLAWPQMKVLPAKSARHAGGDGGERLPEPQVDVVDCADLDELDRRSKYLLDGRQGSEWLGGSFGAVVLKTSGETPEDDLVRLHLGVSHGLGDGFSGMAFLKDFGQCWDAALDEAAEEKDVVVESRSPFSLLERRLKEALIGPPTPDCSDMTAASLDSGTKEAYEHYLWLRRVSVKTLKVIVNEHSWCCALDVGLLAALVLAIARARNIKTLPLRFVASMRDGLEEESMVADLAEMRDLDIDFRADVGIEDAGKAVANAIRKRLWKVPLPSTDASDRIFMNFRPLIKGSSSTKQTDGGDNWTWEHETEWPNVNGEPNWDHKWLAYSMWVMADQVDTEEWVICMKLLWSQDGDRQIGKALKSVLRDLASNPTVRLMDENWSYRA